MQVSITEIIRDRNVIIVRVALDDGKVKAKREYRVTSELELKQRINADIKTMMSLETEFPKLAIGLYDPSISDPIWPKEELDQVAYENDIAKLNSYLRAIALGVIAKDDPGYLAHLDKLKTDFRPEYAELF